MKKKNNLIGQLSNCGISVEEYLSYRNIIGGNLETYIKRLERSPIGDIKFKAEIILQELVNDIRTNKQDGFYTIIITDLNDKIGLNEVISHVFIIEKVGDIFV